MKYKYYKKKNMNKNIFIFNKYTSIGFNII